jgi:hypothetical protein
MCYGMARTAAAWCSAMHAAIPVLCWLALQVTPYEYDLVLQPDINTRGHTQWFFFAVSNTRAGRQYRFNIINLLKEDSLYNNGMLPLMHSERQMRTKVGTHHWSACH